MRSVSHRQSVDKSAHSSLALCSCGWRQLADTGPAAWLAARNHAMRSHYGENCNAINSRYEGSGR